MVAGVIALINGGSHRLAQKKGIVGFLNPVLYAHSEIMDDAVRGSNPRCNTIGFGAEQGWDPVTGLGTPNFAAMAALWNSLP